MHATLIISQQTNYGVPYFHVCYLLEPKFQTIGMEHFDKIREEVLSRRHLSIIVDDLHDCHASSHSIVG